MKKKMILAAIMVTLFAPFQSVSDEGFRIGEWQVGKFIDEIDDSVSMIASIESYSSPRESRTMSIHCSVGEKLNLGFQSTGDFFIKEFASIFLRIDKDKAVELDVFTSGSNILVTDLLAFPYIILMRGSKEVIVRWRPYESIPVTAKFNTSDLHRVVDILEKECKK